MRRFFVAAILCLSCGFRTPLDETQARDGQMPPPKSDAATTDVALADTFAAVDAYRGHADREIVADAAVDGSGPEACHKRSNMRAFSLPLDARPVIATSRIEIPLCSR
jgi:hypothetical protein